MTKVKLSFVIPTYNTAEATEMLVHQLLESDNDEFEVVVVDDC